MYIKLIFILKTLILSKLVAKATFLISLYV